MRGPWNLLDVLQPFLGSSFEGSLPEIAQRPRHVKSSPEAGPCRVRTHTRCVVTFIEPAYLSEVLVRMRSPWAAPFEAVVAARTVPHTHTHTHSHTTLTHTRTLTPTLTLTHTHTVRGRRGCANRHCCVTKRTFAV